MSTLFSGHYLRNRSTLDIGVLGYIGIVQHKEHSPEDWSVPPVTPCILLSNPQVLYGCLKMFLEDEKFRGTCVLAFSYENTAVLFVCALIVSV